MVLWQSAECCVFYSIINRDAPIAIILADFFFFFFFFGSDLPIPIFADSDFVSKNYNWQHIQKKYANINEKLFT